MSGGSLAYVFFTPCFPSFVHKNQFFLRVFYGFRKKRKSEIHILWISRIWVDLNKKTKKHRFSASVHFPERTIHMNNGWQKILQDSLLQPQIRSNSIFCRAEMIAQGPQTFLLFSSLFFVILERLGGNVFLIFKNSKIILINFFSNLWHFFQFPLTNSETTIKKWKQKICLWMLGQSKKIDILHAFQNPAISCCISSGHSAPPSSSCASSSISLKIGVWVWRVVMSVKRRPGPWSL